MTVQNDNHRSSYDDWIQSTLP